MSSISSAELYLEMRSDPQLISRLYSSTVTNDMAAIVYEYAASKGHQIEMSDIYDGVWDAQKLVADAVSEDSLSDEEIELITKERKIVMVPANGDELTDAELELVAGGGGDPSCHAPDGCPTSCQKYSG